jgi:flotillin
MLLQTVVVIVVVLVLVLILALAVLASMLRKVGPNQALIRYGFGGTRIFQGEGALVFPMVHSARELSLELMSFDVAPQQDMYTTQGVAVNVEAVTQLKVKSDPESILTAAEQFLSKAPDAREGLIRLVMEGHLRGIVGQLTVEQIVKQPEMVADKLRATTAEDLAKMGLEIISFTIREVRDRNQYIENMGKPDIARIRREADIAAAEAERDTAIRRADTMREASVARAMADQERVIAETASATRQAEAQRDLELKRADYTRSVQTQKAQADKAYDIQANIMQQQVVAAQVQVEQVQKAEQVKVQEAEILRREKELIATVLRPAEIERQRIQTLAEAERQRLGLEATGRAEAARQQGLAQAEVIKATGEAEAEVIQIKGAAEAKAMNQKADAYRGYTQAAILDRMVSAIPDMVRAAAEPLTKVDTITVVSTDGHGGTGADRVTTDVAKIVAQAPAMLEALTGLKLGDMLARMTPPAAESVTGTNGVDRAIGQQKDGSER